MTVYTIDSANIGTYSLTLSGYITGYPTRSTSANFSLIIADCCLISTIISADIDSYDYAITQYTSDTIATLSWNQS